MQVSTRFIILAIVFQALYKKGMKRVNSVYIRRKALLFLLALCMMCTAVPAQGLPPFADSAETFPYEAGDTDEEVDSENREERPEEPETAENNAAPHETEPVGEHGSASPPSFLFRYGHHNIKGAQFTAGIESRSYAAFLQLQSQMAMPYFELSVKNFGIGLYPLADLQNAYPGKAIPRLFLGAGSLGFGSFLKTANRTGFSAVKSGYGGIHAPRSDFIRLAGAAREVQYGVELSGGGWNAAFFASPEQKRKRMRYGLFGGWQMRRKKSGIIFAIHHLTAFLPDLSADAESAERAAAIRLAQRYHNLFGFGTFFSCAPFSVEAAGFCSYTADKTVSGAGRAEADLVFRYGGIRIGTSYAAPRYLGWNMQAPKELLTVFAQPILTVNIFSLQGLYRFRMHDRLQEHQGGVTIQVKHTNVHWLCNWEYGNRLHTVKTRFDFMSSPAWFRGLRWFDKADAGTAVQLQNRTENPFVLKKYTVFAGSRFRLTDYLSLGIEGLVLQQLRVETDKTAELLFAKWEEPRYKAGVFLQFKKEGIGKVHSAQVSLHGRNDKPYFELTLAYQVQGR